MWASPLQMVVTWLCAIFLCQARGKGLVSSVKRNDLRVNSACRKCDGEQALLLQ